jgi:hypothetical protein
MQANKKLLNSSNCVGTTADTEFVYTKPALGDERIYYVRARHP